MSAHFSYNRTYQLFVISSDSPDICIDFHTHFQHFPLLDILTLSSKFIQLGLSACLLFKVCLHCLRTRKQRSFTESLLSVMPRLREHERIRVIGSLPHTLLLDVLIYTETPLGDVFNSLITLVIVIVPDDHV